MSESRDNLARQNALLIAKIARYEFPNDWPGVCLPFAHPVYGGNAKLVQAISDFITSLRSSDSLRVKRALLALLNIVKELSTARLQLSRRHLQAATPEIIAVVGDLYARAVERWRDGSELEQMELSLIAIELAGRLLISGYEHPNRDATAASFWSLTIDHLTAFIPLLNSINPEVSTSQHLIAK